MDSEPQAGNLRRLRRMRDNPSYVNLGRGSAGFVRSCVGTTSRYLHRLRAQVARALAIGGRMPVLKALKQRPTQRQCVYDQSMPPSNEEFTQMDDYAVALDDAIARLQLGDAEGGFQL